MIMEEPLLIYKKKELRKKMLALRRALSTDETDKMAMCLRANIVSLPQYKKANRIMAFLAMRGESNLDPLIEQALADSALYESNRKDDLIKLMNEQNDLKAKLEQFEEQLLELMMELEELESSFET